MTLAILSRRFRPDGRVLRKLECGHEVTEPHGGNAQKATTVRGCQTCNLAVVRPPPPAQLGTCGAIVLPLKESHARPCGRPAFKLKRGQPRCGFHARSGAR